MVEIKSVNKSLSLDQSPGRNRESELCPFVKQQKASVTFIAQKPLQSYGGDVEERLGVTFHHQHGLLRSSVSQHLPAVALAHVPDKARAEGWLG